MPDSMPVASVRSIASSLAHRVPEHHGEDVAARGVGQRMEERVSSLGLDRIYNHAVIRSRASIPTPSRPGPLGTSPDRRAARPQLVSVITPARMNDAAQIWSVFSHALRSTCSPTRS